MRHPIRFLARRTAVAAVLVTIALALVPTAFGDSWARDHADAVAIQALDPAIRTAITARRRFPRRSPRRSRVSRRPTTASPGVRRRSVSSRGSGRCVPCSCVSAWCDTMDGFDTPEPKSGVRTSPRPDPWHADQPISIRPARARELREIAALYAPALEPYRGSGSDWILDAYLAELVDVRPRFAEAEVLVAEHDGRIAGRSRSTRTFGSRDGATSRPAGPDSARSRYPPDARRRNRRGSHPALRPANPRCRRGDARDPYDLAADGRR